MYGTFRGCSSLTATPILPDGIKDIDSTFWGCTSLTTASTIPNTVTNMSNTFKNCKVLTGTITINAKPMSYDGCFAGTVQPIVLSGTASTTYLTNLAATSTNGNVTVQR